MINIYIGMYICIYKLPPTALGSTYGTTPKVPPSVILVKEPHQMSTASKPPVEQLSLLRVEKTINATPMMKVCWKSACRRPRIPKRVQ